MNIRVMTILVITASSFLISACTKKATTINDVNNLKATPTAMIKPTTEMYIGQQTDPIAQKEKLCGWIDKSDIIIELSFADGVQKDTSYETGFYYSPIMSNMKLARRDCDYRTGFNFSEMKNKGAVEVGVRGYSDNVRRKLEGEPHSVVFDKDGKPNIALPIKVKVLN